MYKPFDNNKFAQNRFNSEPNYRMFKKNLGFHKAAHTPRQFIFNLQKKILVDSILTQNFLKPTK